MKLLTTEEVEVRRAEVKSELEAQVRNLDRLKKRMEVGGILAVLVWAAIVIWGVSSGGDLVDIAAIAVSAGIISVAAAVAAGAVTVAVAAVAFGAAFGAAVGAVAVAAFGVDAAIAVAVGAVAVAVVVAAAMFAEYFLGKNEGKIQKLEQKLKNFAEINPKITPDACNDFATLVDQGEPLAVDLHRQVKEAGRKPTMGEIEELKSEIEKKNAPPSPEEQAKESCERLFGH